MYRCLCRKFDFFDHLAQAYVTKTKILREAHAHGRENYPPRDENGLTPIEQEIIDRCEERISALRRYAERQLHRSAAEFRKYELTAVDLDIKGAAEEAAHKIALLRGATKDNLLQSRLVERDRFRELSHFKAENNLSRSALYPQSRLLAISLLLAIIVGEAVLNARLFATVDVLGLLGGWLQALIVSVMNILPSFLVGIVALRNLHHRRMWRRCTAFLAALASAIVLVGYNLVVAHFRVVLSIDPDNAAERAIPHFTANPWDITATMDAVLLFALGLFAAACAMLDGYCLVDDRYPGYGTIDRRYRAALAAYGRIKHAFRRDIERIVSKIHHTINRRLKKLHKKVEAGVTIINKGALTLCEAEVCAAHGAHVAHRLLAAYREANMRIRTISPPAYFSTYPALDTALVPDPFDLEEKKQRMREALASKMREASHAQAWLRHYAEREIAAIDRCVDESETAASFAEPPSRLSGNLQRYER